MKVLVVQSWGIGDAIMTLPLIRGMVEHGLKVDLLVGAGAVRDLLEPEVLTERILVRPSASLRRVPGFLHVLSATAFRYDALILAWSLTPWKRIPLALISGAKSRIAAYFGRKPPLGYTEGVPLKKDVHFVEGNVALGRLLVPDMTVTSPKLTISAAEVDKARTLATRAGLPQADTILGIHPGCDGRNVERRWPLERFVEIAECFSEKPGRAVWVFIGPSEKEMLPSFSGLKRVGVVTGHGLRETASVISLCKVFLTSDSGLGHIASAAGVPVVTLFGPADERQTRPYAKNDVVITAPVECRPCIGRHGYRTCQDRKCLKLITCEQVLAALEELLRQV